MSGSHLNLACVMLSWLCWMCSSFIAPYTKHTTALFRRRSITTIHKSWNGLPNGDDTFQRPTPEGLEMNELMKRVREMRLEIMEEDTLRPPNPNLSPQQLVTQILDGLRNPDDPLPDYGYRLLLRSSTPMWRKSIIDSIGAPASATPDVISSALGAALGRPKNQYGILVNDEDEDDYIVRFPTDVVDLEDGDCWLECRLLRPSDGELLVILGWQLKRRQADGAWLVDKVDWQDFREAYRPGIGREEWTRSCG